MQAHALTQQTIHTSACTHIYTYTHACTHTYTHTHTHAHSHTRTHTGVHHEEFWHTNDNALLVVDRLTHSHTRTHTHTHSHTHAHTLTHTHTHSHTHTGVHHEEFWHTDDDALLVVDKLNADQAYARKLAETGTTFAENYLVKDVMMVSLRRTTE